LVVLLDTLAADTAVVSQALVWLRAMALAAGMDLFLHAAEVLQTERQSACDEIHRHPETFTAPPEEFLHRAEPHSYRDWGINE
jgi:hypothetical protein